MPRSILSNPYETERLLGEYLLFHYGSPAEILPDNAPTGMADALDFPVRTQARFRTPAPKRALDLGCAVGRSTYELSRTCSEVIGIDFSHAFIRAAEALKRGPLPYLRHDEAHLNVKLEARLPAGIDTSRVRFMQGDAMNLPDILGPFDCVHAANLLCRLSEPELLLERLPDLVVSGGELILATPCSWSGEFTQPEHWPLGSTLDWLKISLGDDFELVERCDEPFLIRETARKFQWTSSMLTRWQRF